MTATPERHPDIEIYVDGINTDQALAWLEQRFDRVEPGRRQAKQCAGSLHWEGTRIPFLIMERAAGRFTSLWFDSAATPWATDRDCARDAWQQFQREVRCILSGWQEGDDPDEWWSLSEQGERQITWREG